MSVTTGMAPIRNFALGIFDGPHATPKPSDEGPIFLGIKNVSEDGRLDFSEIRHVSDTEFSKWTRRVLPQKDDIVFSYEATLHRYARIPEGFVGCLGRRMGLVRPNQKRVDPAFLHYYFLSPIWRAKMEAITINGATVNRIPLTIFPDILVDFPDLNRQRAIAETLSAYDDLIENNRRRIALLEKAARLLYREWFVRFRFPGHEHVRIIDGLPEGWEATIASAAMEVLSGGTPKTVNSSFWNGEIRFFTPKDATDQVYAYQTEKTITEDGLRACNSQLYPVDTIFITARGTVGKLNLALVPMAMNQSCYALRSRTHLGQRFLYLALKSGIEQFCTRATGAVFDAIIVATFDQIPFVIPSASLTNIFSLHVKPIFDQIANLIQQNQKLAQARDLLLPRLMNGEIAV